MYLSAVNSFFLSVTSLKVKKKKDLKLLKYFLYHHMNVTTHYWLLCSYIFTLVYLYLLCFCIANKYKTLLGISCSK